MLVTRCVCLFLVSFPLPFPLPLYDVLLTYYHSYYHSVLILLLLLVYRVRLVLILLLLLVYRVTFAICTKVVDGGETGHCVSVSWSPCQSLICSCFVKASSPQVFNLRYFKYENVICACQICFLVLYIFTNLTKLPYSLLNPFKRLGCHRICQYVRKTLFG